MSVSIATQCYSKQNVKNTVLQVGVSLQPQVKVFLIVLEKIW